MAGINYKGYLKHWVLTLLVTIGVLLLTFLIPNFVGGLSAQDSNMAQEGEPKGNVYNLYDRVLGSVDIEGKVTNRYGRYLGAVDSSGSIVNVSKIVIGKVTPEGDVMNQSGTKLGSVSADGTISNVSGRKVGEVREVGDIILIGGAARLLFLGVSSSK